MLRCRFVWEHRYDERGGRVDGLRYASVFQVCCDRKEGEVHPWSCCLLYFFVSQILGSVVLGFQEPKITQQVNEAIWLREYC